MYRPLLGNRLEPWKPEEGKSHHGDHGAEWEQARQATHLKIATSPSDQWAADNRARVPRKENPMHSHASSLPPLPTASHTTHPHPPLYPPKPPPPPPSRQLLLCSLAASPINFSLLCLDLGEFSHHLHYWPPPHWVAPQMSWTSSS